jgi:hypothetical protein
MHWIRCQDMKYQDELTTNQSLMLLLVHWIVPTAAQHQLPTPNDMVMMMNNRIFYVPPLELVFLGKSLSRGNGFEKNFHVESFWDIRPWMVVWQTFDIDPNVCFLPQGCRSTWPFKTFSQKIPQNDLILGMKVKSLNSFVLEGWSTSFESFYYWRENVPCTQPLWPPLGDTVDLHVPT